MLFIQSLSIGVKPRLFFLSEFEHVLPITCNSLFPPVALDCFIASTSSGISSMCPGAGGAFGSFRRPCPFATRQYSVRTFRSYSRDDLLQSDRKLVRVERSSFPYFFPWRRDFIPGVHTQIILFFTTETRSTYIDLSEFVALAVASIQLNCFLFLASSYRQFARQRVSAEFRRRVCTIPLQLLPLARVT